MVRRDQWSLFYIDLEGVEEMKEEEDPALIKQSSVLSNVSIDNTQSLDIIREELEDCLMNTFPDDIEIISPIVKPEDLEPNTKYLGSFSIRISPHTVEENNFCYAKVKVTYMAGYPHRAPRFEILSSDCKSLRDY